MTILPQIYVEVTKNVSFIALFICDLKIKVLNIKEILPILTIDLKFIFKTLMKLFIRKTSPPGFLK